MPDLKLLKSRGLDYESLKKTFDTTNLPDEKIRALIGRIQSRITMGRDFSYKHHKHWHAIDKLVETPFRQASTAVLMDFASQDASSDKVVQAANDWGLTHLIVERKDPKTGKPQKALNVPVFFNVMFPLARSLSIVRAAKLTIDRAQTPLLKWEPPHSTPKLRKQCEVITDRCELMTNELGYRNQMKQAILRTAQYGHALQFIREEWYKETELDADGKERTLREGLRFKLPHNSWCYYDLNFPLSTLNSDSGCEYVGYWSVQQYRSLRMNDALWNTSRITMNESAFSNYNSLFFALNGCLMKAPSQFDLWKTMDREGSQDRFYTNNFDDAAVMLAEHFERLTPKDEGLGSYPYPIWMRFVVAADNTIVYAAPLPSTPATYWGYDPDDARMFNVGMALEAAPWEVAITNLLTQGLLSVKQNLANLTLVNEDLIDGETRKLLDNLGESQYRQNTLVPLSFRKVARMQYKPSDAAYSVQFPRHDVNGIWSAISTVMGLMERSLGISPQESGSAASHEQTSEEIRMISQNVSVRLEYSSLGIDDAVFAWKKQLYAYLMAYGGSECYAYISTDGMTKEQIEALGFTVDEMGGDKTRVKATRDELKMEYFSSSRDGQDRANNMAIGTQMIQLLAPLASRLVEVVPANDVVLLYNGVLDLMGLPRDWRLKSADTPQTPMAQQQWVVDQITQLAKKVGDLVRGSTDQLAKEVGQEVQQVSQQMAQLAKIISGTAQVTKQNSAEIQKLEEELAHIAQLAAQNEQSKLNGRAQAIPGAEASITVPVQGNPAMVSGTGISGGM